jgi:diguanylate cyclase (GGDEF)-like protein
MIQGTYAPGLVGMSILVAIVAAYTAIDLARRIASTRDRASRWWLIGGACAMGTGIWSMHFVGMLAYRLPVPTGYDPGITLLSWLIAIAASGFALWLTSRPQLSLHRWIVGSLILGGGIAGMHYTGMEAMRMQPAIDYARGLFASSIVVAVVVSGMGLRVMHVLRTAPRHVHWLRLAAALLIGLSIVGMHYLAMAAARFPAGSICGAAGYGLHAERLATLIIVGSLGMLTMALVISLLDQMLQSRTAALANSLASANQKLTQLALHDPLTRLPNRMLLEERLAQSIALGKRFAVIYMDLDGFKAVNDALGHHMGDQLLVEVAGRLEAVRRPTDVISRQGGDEFVLLVHVDDRGDAEAEALRLIELIRQTVVVDAQPLHVSASIGIALHPADGADPATLLSNADAAMYHAKKQGRNGYCFFESRMNKQAQTLLQLTKALAPALARNEFRLLYQPQYDATTGSLVGVEALVRWHHPTRGVIAPDVFIPLAERSGLIVELGVWILDAACRQLLAWHREGHPVQMSVNLSAAQFCNMRLVEDIKACLEKYALPSRYLTLEITESTAMQDVEHSMRMLRQLRALGVRLSIDDFGTGYSSLAYLKRLPASELKIDRNFVQGLCEGQEDAAIVSAIIALGKTLGLTVIAEGVETREQQEFLARQGCDILQGYLLGPPTWPETLHLADCRTNVIELPVRTLEAAASQL